MKSLTNKNCAWWWLRPPFTGCSSTFWQAQAFVATYSTIYEEETLAHGSKIPVLYCQLQPSWVNFYSSKRLRSQICCILSSNKLWSLAKLQEWWLWSMMYYSTYRGVDVRGLLASRDHICSDRSGTTPHSVSSICFTLNLWYWKYWGCSASEKERVL